jgi:hypothetical protein
MNRSFNDTIVCFLISVVAVILYSCTPMDNNYKDFVNDGPITYIAKLNDTEVKAIGERNRVHFIWPRQEDPRGVKAEIYWSNKTRHHTVPVNPSVETDFYIDGLDEASYIFEIAILDDEGNSSIPIPITATVYGDLWESYLPNRNMIENVQEGADRRIFYRENVEQTMLGTDFEWIQDGESFAEFVESSQTTVYLSNFKASSFRYRTRYLSEEGGTDIFYSPWQYYVENVSPEDIDAGFDKITSTFELPTVNDGNWIGYEFRWTDKTTGEARTQSTSGNTITLSNYNSVAVNIFSLFRFGELPIVTMGQEYSTVRYVDLDRSTWFVEPETKVSDGSALWYVNQLTVSGTLNETTNKLSNYKNKSPYLSHLLPHNTAATNDGLDGAKSHFDNNTATYLMMVKGNGADREDITGARHSNGGVWSDGTDIYFIIKLDNVPQTFNYFRFIYRPSQDEKQIKPWLVTFFGSNDDNCLTDESKWEMIEEGIKPDKCDIDISSAQPVSAHTTVNMLLPDSEFKYVIMRIDAWSNVTGNTLQIAEFFLGYYY